MATAVQPQQKPTYDELMQALVKYEDATTYEAQDITTAEYKRDSEFGSLEWGGTKYELSEWSARQMCRLAGIPYGVFGKASEKLAVDMFKEFTPGIKDPHIKLAVKAQGQAKRVLRGILPVDYPDIRNSQVVEALQGMNEPFEIESAGWMDQTSPTMLRTRVTFPNFTKQVNNEELKIGIDITSSELGACPLQTNVLLFRTICTNGAIASYGRKPYFYFDYSSTLVVELGDVFAQAVKRATRDVDVIMDRVKTASQTSFSQQKAQQVLMDAVKEGALNKGVVLKTLGTLEKDGCKTIWDFVNALTAQARGFRDSLRLKYEAAAGNLLGLAFDRITSEDQFAPTAKEMPLLQAVT